MTVLSKLEKEYKYIFIRIPRCASTTLDTVFSGGRVDCRHMPLEELEKRLPHIKHYFKFAFIRDPAERFTSAYYYWAHRLLDRGRIFSNKGFLDYYNTEEKLGGQREKFDTISKLFSEHKTPSELLRAMEGNPRFLFSLDQVFRPQSDWLSPDLDFVGNLDTIEEDIKYLVDKLGLPHVTTVPKRNSHRKPYKYSTEAMRILRGIYKDNYYENYTKVHKEYIIRTRE